ncbi:MAG: hypothetical protein ACKVOW_04395 [Chitinophagaceae bacterium]
MNERLPYEENLHQHWHDLPLPMEDDCWKDMERRLKEEDDDKVIAWWRRGCGIWILLLVGLVAGGWWFLSVKKKDDHKETIIKPVLEKKPVITKDTNLISSTIRPVFSSIPENNYHNREKKNATKKEKEESELIIINQSPKIVTINNKVSRITKAIHFPKIKIKQASLKDKIISNPNSQRNDLDKSKKGIRKDNQDEAMSKNELLMVDTTQAYKESNDSVERKDSIKSISKSITKQITITKPTRDSLKDRTYFFSGGLALNQQLPIAGQNFTTYSALGRKGNLADYIPSLYIRFSKKEKWFIQAEFRYGAPQYTKQFVYAQQFLKDTISNTTTITSVQLKKTFYHQLPVSFNYYVLPNWSVGAGLTWNRFKGAVSEQQVLKRNLITLNDSLIRKEIITDSGNSVFSRSFFQGMLETQYQWKKFTFGARYSFGLQPYIKFTLPGGRLQQEKNTAIQFFLRYQLWHSKNLLKKK